MMLHFDQTKVPRSTTRAEWREMDRWRRTTEARIRAEQYKQLEMLTLYGTTNPELAAELADRIINPPVLLGPHQ
jgi:hypothetical protein